MSCVFSDGHDTDVNYQAQWLSYWLVPLLKDPNFNTEKTLILLTFDELVYRILIRPTYLWYQERHV